MMDADILLPQHDLCRRAVETLISKPNCRIASDVSRKDFRGIPRFAPARILSRMFENKSSPIAPLCGQFYCAKAEYLRDVVLPSGLLSQDGYIRAITLTSGFLEPENTSYICLVEGGYHLHPAFRSLRANFRYQKRQAIGTAIYPVVYGMLERGGRTFKERMDLIARLNRDNANWLGEAVFDQGIDRTKEYLRRYSKRKLKGFRLSIGTFIRIPLVLLGYLIDLVICALAMREFQKTRFGSVDENKGRFTAR